VKLDPIDENGLEKYATQFDSVSVYITDHPEMIQSDLSIINSNTLSISPTNPDDKPAAASKLIWSVLEQRDRSKVGAAFTKEKNDASTETTLFAARFPAMDLPVKRLIVFEPARGQRTSGSSDFGLSVDKVKSFYLKELRKEQGRAVIQSPSREYACEGLRQAVEELRRKEEGPDEIIIAAYSSEKYISEKFQPPNQSGLTE
jgi:hypothetical protein